MIKLFQKGCFIGVLLLILGFRPFAQETDTAVYISGRIIDQLSNRGVFGARVQVADFSATISDTLGYYRIKVPAATAVLQVEADGFINKTIPVNHRSLIDIYLMDVSFDRSYYEALNITGAGTTKKYLNAAADKFTVNPWQQPMGIPDELLQGRIAGLNAIRRSGLSSSGANLVLRGFNSLYGSSTPLILVDGIPYDAHDYGTSLIANNYTNPFSLIDPKDIDNIVVLKDASSIYGARGANGAIMINTIQAPDQVTRIDAGLFTGINMAPEALPVMNAAGYRSYLSRLLVSKGMNPSEINQQPYMNDDPGNPDFYKYHNDFDWQDKVFRNSMSRNAYIRITGGDNIAVYGLTVGYLKNEGVVRETNFERYNTRFNAQFNFNKKITGFANLSYSYNNQVLKDQGNAEKSAPILTSLIKAPFLHDHVLNSQGIASPNLEDVDLFGMSNPSAIIDLLQASNKYYRFFGSFGLNYQLNKYVRIGSTIGLTMDKVRETFFVPGLGVQKDTLWNEVAKNSMGSQVRRLFSLFNETLVAYSNIFNKIHSLNARAGLRIQSSDSRQVSVTTANSATDDLIYVQNGLAALRQVTGGYGKWSWLNTFVGIDYGFQEKLFLSVNAAMDGSSRFGPEVTNGMKLGKHPFGVFPSVNASWLLTSERFMSRLPINLLKLRLSYGIAGNYDIGNYSGRLTYQSQNLLGAQGLVRSGIQNPQLQWETVYKSNVGVDIVFAKESVSLAVDLYRNYTKNMLVFSPLESVTGFATILTNDGEMRNQGMEVTLNARPVNGRAFKWDLGLTVAGNSNRIIAVPNGSFTNDLYGATILTQVHQPAAVFFGYKTNGVFQTQAEADAAGLVRINADGSVARFNAGDVRFTDLNGDKIIDENDRAILGNPNPKLFGGLLNKIIYKRFELTALLTFSAGNEVYNGVRHRLEAQSDYANQLPGVLNSWQVDGQVTSMPRTAWGDPMGNSRFSDRWIEDGSYIRLRTVNFTYDLPLKDNSAFKKIAISITGNNLFTFSDYLGYDPEYSVTNSPFTQGIDAGMDPLYRSVLLGVRLGL